MTGILDQLNQWLADNLLPYFVKMPLWFPLIMGGIVLGIVIVWRGMKTEVKIDEAEKSDLPDFPEPVDDSPPRFREIPDSSARKNGGADLEGRLIAALAGAPWMVKDGSQIALTKKADGAWGIETNRIVFALESKKEEPPTTRPEPEIPPPPESEETPEAV